MAIIQLNQKLKKGTMTQLEYHLLEMAKAMNTDTMREPEIRMTLHKELDTWKKEREKYANSQTRICSQSPKKGMSSVIGRDQVIFTIS